MEANVHIPERLDGESFSAYKARRIESRRIAAQTHYVAPAGNHNRKEERIAKRRIGPRQYRIARKSFGRPGRAA